MALRRFFRHPSAFAPLAMSFAALATVLLHVIRFGTAREVDEGTSAHIWQLLMGAQLPVIAFFLAGMPATLEFPEKGRFNIRGGMEILPELVALVIGLTFYTGAFIAEVVRAGIMAVSRGQTEAAGALGLRTGQTLKLVVIPQAMRVIIPPLTSQYLNLTKNSTLAVFVGYPDLVQIFTGTVLNQTGQAVEVVMITMAVYLTISLVTSTVMNWYNSRIALVER